MQRELFIFTDGGARGNPGPAAIGVFIQDQRGKVIAQLGKKIGNTTNNQAEYKAILEGLSWVIENGTDVKSVNFFLDSELICRQITGRYRVKNKDLTKLLSSAREKEAKIKAPLFYNYVSRSKNKNADKLVNLALDNKL